METAFIRQKLPWTEIGKNLQSQVFDPNPIPRTDEPKANAFIVAADTKWKGYFKG